MPASNTHHLSLIVEEPPRPIQLWRACLAEFYGTLLLVFVGCSSVAQSFLFGKLGGPAPFISVNFAWALAVTLGALTAGTISGAHLNPAVSFTLATLGRFSWHRLLPFWISQLLGSFCGAGLVYWIYIDGIEKIDGGHRAVTGDTATAGIFATYPADYTSIAGRFFDELMGTFILMTGISAINDDRNIAVPLPLKPLFVGFVILAVGTSFGVNTGFAINPARDLGPRMFTAIPYGSDVFTSFDHYWWIPIVAPMLGGTLGGWTYNLLVERMHGNEGFFIRRIAMNM